MKRARRGGRQLFIEGGEEARARRGTPALAFVFFLLLPFSLITGDFQTAASLTHIHTHT